MTRSVHEGSGTRPSIDELTENQGHRLFAARRRRTTFEVLREEAGPVALEDLAAAVARRERRRADDEAVERVATTLHHVHLPKMDDFGVIDYDPDERLVAPASLSDISSP